MLCNTLLLFVVLLLSIVSISSANGICRGSFPKGFVFGTSSSAYQFEGAVKEDGRGPSIWDIFAHTPGKIVDGSNADIADDQYHLYPEDIQIIRDLGADAYRLSIAWPRIYPNGTGKINKAGVDHYNKVIDELLANGITPYVTIYHWDLPQSLEDKYLGWLSPTIISDFANFAETCFEEFGDRVKHWITLNEPYSVSIFGYGLGAHAPGRCSFRPNCTAGNTFTEPYIVAHNLLLSHATAVHIYRTKYQAKQKGHIGITLDSSWYESATNKPADIAATKRAIDFELGWFIEPLIFGKYPNSMITRVGNRLPKFSPPQSASLKGSFDFIGINHYTTLYVNATNSTLYDSGAIFSLAPPGKPAVTLPLSTIHPHGIRRLMNYIKIKYNNPLIIITENGYNDGDNEHPLNDTKRIEYLNSYLENLLLAIRDGSNVKGYFVWSLLDDWEWNDGYTWRLGLIYVDLKHENLKRIPKASAKWYKNFLTNRS